MNYIVMLITRRLPSWNTLKNTIPATQGIQNVKKATNFLLGSSVHINPGEQKRSLVCSHCSTIHNPLLRSHDIGTVKFRDPPIPETEKQFKDTKLFYEKGVPFSSLKNDDFQIAVGKFNLTGLKKESLDKFNVKLSIDGNSLLFPLCGLDKEIVAIQFLTSKPDEKIRRLEKSSFPRVSEATVFGWPQVDHSCSEIVLTSDPLDALVINQEAGVTAISLPHDAQVFPAEILQLLEQFQKVTLWLSDDNPDWRTLVGEKLGGMSYFIRHDKEIPSPLRCLQTGLSTVNILSRAYPLTHKYLATFETFAGDVLKEHPEKCSGTKWKRFTQLNEILKGHRRGELTIFSGQTGTGKTTFMSEYSLDLCMQGVRTLWASFEISNHRLIEIMLMQFALCPLEDVYKRRDYWKTQFKSLKLHFLMLHGQHSIKTVIDAMVHAVIANGVQHVIVDNLQFMINADDMNSSLDLYRLQDRIFSEFRRFATLYNCHVTLVIHPRKEPESAELSNNSISGTAKATQEADNIIILQSTKQRQYIQVTKNRFDGARGHFFIEFDKPTRSFSSNFKKKPQNPTLITPSS